VPLGEQGQRVRHIASLGSESNRINRAISRLRETFDRLFSVEDLASEPGVSPSTFHYHVKRVTALSPLRFQKQFQEARRLMIGEDFDATTPVLRVG
jgi:AraC-like DNA-binding protein